MSVNAKTTKLKNHQGLEGMLQDKKDVITAKYLWIMKGLLAHVVIDNLDVFPEVGKERKNI